MGHSRTTDDGQRMTYRTPHIAQQKICSRPTNVNVENHIAQLIRARLVILWVVIQNTKTKMKIQQARAVIPASIITEEREGETAGGSYRIGLSGYVSYG